MIRILYRVLLSLHPREFREQFAWEMLWIFDEGAAAIGPLPLLADALASLVRQWLVRSGALPYAISVLANATIFTALFLWPNMSGGGKQLQSWAEPAPAPVHYRLYVSVEPPTWDENQALEHQAQAPRE